MWPLLPECMLKRFASESFVACQVFVLQLPVLGIQSRIIPEGGPASMSNCVKSKCANWRGVSVQNIFVSFGLASVSYKEKLLSEERKIKP